MTQQSIHLNSDDSQFIYLNIDDSAVYSFNEMTQQFINLNSDDSATLKLIVIIGSHWTQQTKIIGLQNLKQNCNIIVALKNRVYIQRSQLLRHLTTRKLKKLFINNLFNIHFFRSKLVSKLFDN